MKRRMLQLDPRLRRALDVELQHVAVVLGMHGRPPFMAVRWMDLVGTSGWTRTTGLDLRRVALLPLSYGRLELVAPDDFALPRSGRTSRSNGPKAEHEVRANVDLRLVRALLCL